MDFFQTILEDPGYLPYKLGLIFSEFSRFFLVGLSLSTAWAGAIVASHMHELRWFAKALVALLVTLLLFGLVMSLTYLAPVFFDYGALIESQKIKP